MNKVDSETFSLNLISGSDLKELDRETIWYGGSLEFIVYFCIKRYKVLCFVDTYVHMYEYNLIV